MLYAFAMVKCYKIIIVLCTSLSLARTKSGKCQVILAIHASLFGTVQTVILSLSPEVAYVCLGESFAFTCTANATAL